MLRITPLVAKEKAILRLEGKLRALGWTSWPGLGVECGPAPD